MRVSRTIRSRTAARPQAVLLLAACCQALAVSAADGQLTNVIAAPPTADSASLETKEVIFSFVAGLFWRIV
jgi:hypothetical protein